MKKIFPKKIFPWPDTQSERKKFAVFHACTFILFPVIGVFIAFGFRAIGATGQITETGSWVAMSLFCWSMIGAWLTANKINDFWHSRLIVALLLLGFPFFYLYNLLRIFVKKIKTKC